MDARNPKKSEVKGIYYHLESIHFQGFLWWFRPVSFFVEFLVEHDRSKEINKSTDLGGPSFPDSTHLAEVNHFEITAGQNDCLKASI